MKARRRPRAKVARFMAIAGGTQLLTAPDQIPGTPVLTTTTDPDGYRYATLAWEPPNATVCVSTREAVEQHVDLLNQVEDARRERDQLRDRLRRALRAAAAAGVTP